MVRVLGRDVFDNISVLKNEFGLKTTLTLTKNANPSLCVREDERKCIFYD